MSRNRTLSRLELLGRVVVGVALLAAGWVHLDLASTYEGIGDRLTVGDLFRLQGVVAVVLGLAVVVLRRRWVLLAATLVGLGSALATTLSVYIRVPPLGPFPELYEPVWYDEKLVAAVTAGVAGVVGSVLLARSVAGGRVTER